MPITKSAVTLLKNKIYCIVLLTRPAWTVMNVTNRATHFHMSFFCLVLTAEYEAVRGLHAFIIVAAGISLLTL